MSARQAKRLVEYAYKCAEAGYNAMQVYPAPRHTVNPAKPTQWAIYRLLVDNRPFYVGQSADVPSRICNHISTATGKNVWATDKDRIICEALRAGKRIEYEIIDWASTRSEALQLEQEWIVKTIQEGHNLTNR